MLLTVASVSFPSEVAWRKGIPESFSRQDGREAASPQKGLAYEDRVDISPEGNQKERARDSEKLSEEEIRQVEEMKKRDREVRAHEQAHLAAAGGYTRGGIHLKTERGPDGKAYAVGGHVNLDVSEEKTPEATLQKAIAIQKAALAPADPSPQDRAVAAQAAQMAQKARQEMRKKQGEDTSARSSGEEKSSSFYSGYDAFGKGVHWLESRFSQIA